jgi:hypothetical protein
MLPTRQLLVDVTVCGWCDHVAQQLLACQGNALSIKEPLGHAWPQHELQPIAKGYVPHPQHVGDVTLLET